MSRLVSSAIARKTELDTSFICRCIISTLTNYESHVNLCDWKIIPLWICCLATGRWREQGRRRPG